MSPFLTEVDPRRKVSGSRDPLGAQTVWAAVGRRLVGNLTLASNDIAGVRTFLLGIGMSDAAQPPRERLRRFLRWEQVAAGCRVVADDNPPPLGARRVRSRLETGNSLPIHEDDEQILLDQRRSGLWALYYRALRDSGLVDERRRLTATGQSLVDHWLPSVPDRFLRVVRATPSRSVALRSAPDAFELAALLRGGVKTDRTPLRRHLVDGFPEQNDAKGQAWADGVQPRLAAHLAAHRSALASLGWKQRVEHLETAAAADPELASRLRDVLACESVLHPAQALLDDLLVSGPGHSPREFATAVATSWPQVPATVRLAEFQQLTDRVLRPVLGRERADLWVQTARAMSTGDWAAATAGVVGLNDVTMQLRGGAGWVSIGDVVTVRLPVGAELVTEDKVIDGWLNPYYLTPLWSLDRGLARSA